MIRDWVEYVCWTRGAAWAVDLILRARARQ